MANPVVRCTVDECAHYKAGDQCMAAQISVYNQGETGHSRDRQDTQCKSFHSRKTVGDLVGSLHNANVMGTVTAAFMDGTQITPNVECFVNNCHHWETNNRCRAESIQVSGPNAGKTDDTDCETFSPK
ncbi:DUF1540 domain-containing protein [Acetonema longum]|uniref:DUF1540 domain-containing protein n=1 Tax=Acetonema longum DSM 6540 TaxID=1009370 RepID=F7NDF2_9FIRM|nr:DUF1540 domain-containing protein [Acetonema longum]EGO65905.1 hypothetical protein ALO_00295 [Acetonema longum DSM 6540]